MTDVNKAGSADNLDEELNSLPEKYKGKTPVEIARMHMELESAYSRQGNELGDYRRLATTLAETGLQTSKEPPKQRTPVTTEELLENPDKTLESAIEAHPAVKQARETAENLERQLAQQRFEQAHPSFRDDIADPSFSEWVRKSAALVRLAKNADNFDMDSADQLWSLWEEKKSLTDQSKEKLETKTKREKQERAGILEGNSGADASTETVYSRSDIRELRRKAHLGDRASVAKVNDPKWKAAILQAYKDKRVS